MQMLHCSQEVSKPFNIDVYFAQCLTYNAAPAQQQQQQK